MLAVALPALGAKWTPVDADRAPDRPERAHRRRRAPSAGLRRRRRDARDGASAHRLRRRRRRRFAARIEGLDGVTRGRPRRAGWRHHLAAERRIAGDAAGETARGVVDEIRAAPAPFAATVTGAGRRVRRPAGRDRLPAAPRRSCCWALTFVVLWLMTGSVVLPVKAIADERADGRRRAGAADAHLPGRPLTGCSATPPTAASNRPTSSSPPRSCSRSPPTTACSCSAASRRRATAASGEREAVAAGLARTGRVVTAAAILLAVAIGAFTTSSIPFIQQIGVATATGVLLDAFIVRTLLVPSLMALLGRLELVVAPAAAPPARADRAGAGRPAGAVRPHSAVGGLAELPG